MSVFEQYEDYDAIGLADLVRRRDVSAEEGLVLSEGLQKTRRSRRCSQVSL